MMGRLNLENFIKDTMKGIILAGGTATRLFPSTLSISKHLLNVYDKPMIYYPLSVLMLAGIREILIITTSNALPAYRQLLSDGERLGIKIFYAVQEKPKGIADAFVVAEEFIGGSSVCLILGDNIFYGHGFLELLREACALNKGAKVFGYYVKDPRQYGVVEFEEKTSKVLSIEEKPSSPKSNYAVPVLYFFDNSVIEKAKNVKPSARGELEITSIIQNYLDSSELTVSLIGRGVAWLDTGTHENLLEASNFIAVIENRQGLKIACLEEVAYNCGYIDKDQLIKLGKTMEKSTYGAYILNLKTT